MMSLMVRSLKQLGFFLRAVTAVVINGFPARRFLVVGVTGTDGKTTTSHLIFEILKRNGWQVGLVSTLGAFVGDEEVGTGLHVTTPDPFLLQVLLRGMVNSGVAYVVLEATSHGLDQLRVWGCNFKVGVLTNVTHEHLDYHGSFENYVEAKSKLFRGVKVAVLNKGDQASGLIRGKLRRGVRVVSYGLGTRASLRVDRVKLGSDGMMFWVREGEKRYRLKTVLVGNYNVANILAAVGAVRALGVGWKVIRRTLEEFKGVKGRMEVIDEGQPFSVIVDFAHTPNALKLALGTLRRLKGKEGRLICVFGCAGERDVLKRPMMAGVATQLADLSIFTAEDPRHESVDKIIQMMASGVSERWVRERTKGQLLKGWGDWGRVFTKVPDRREAIELAVKIAKEGDIVALLGKGHEKSLAFGDEERPWSDEGEVRRILGRTR